MQLNKLIYALADVALVVSAEVDKGGTWAGATEQLDKLRLVPIYVRECKSSALSALMDRGARVWSSATTLAELDDLLVPNGRNPVGTRQQTQLALDSDPSAPELGPEEPSVVREEAWTVQQDVEEGLPDAVLMKTVRTLIRQLTRYSKSSEDIAAVRPVFRGRRARYRRDVIVCA